MHRGTFPILCSFAFKFGAFLCAIAMCATHVSAQDLTDLKKAVHENCNAALLSELKLSDDGKKEFAGYLRLILEVAKQSANAEPYQRAPALVSTSVAPIGARPNTSIGADFMRLAEPQRESGAKECAITLLEHMGSDAFEAVPELLSLSMEKSVSYKVADMSENAAWTIALATSREDSCPEDQNMLQRLFEKMTSLDSSMPANVLIQTGQCSLNYLVDTLQNSDSEVQKKVIEILRTIDDSGHLLGPQFIRLLGEPDSDTKELGLKLLATIRPFYSEAVFPVLKMLHDPSQLVQEQALNSLRSMFSVQGLLSQHPHKEQILQILINEFGQRPDGDRGVLQEGLLQFDPAIKLYQEEMSKLSDSLDPALRKRAMLLLAAPMANSDELLLVLKKGLGDLSTDVQLASIAVLGKHPEAADKVFAAFAQLLKGSASRDNVLLHQRRICAVAQATISLVGQKAGVGKSADPLIPYFIDALVFHVPQEVGWSCDAAAESLIALGGSAISSLTKLSKDKDEYARERAVNVLAAMKKPRSEKVLLILLDLLRDKSPVVVEAVKFALGLYGEDFGPRIQHAIKTANPASQLILSESLLIAGQSNKDVEERVEKAAIDGSCDDGLELAAYLFTAHKQLSIKAREKLLKCLREGHGKQAQIAAFLASLSHGQGADQKLTLELLDVIKTANFDAQVKVLLLKKAKELGLSPQDVLEQGLPILKSPADETVKTNILEVFESLGPSAAPALSDVMALLEGEDKDRITLPALRVLFNVQAKDFDYSAFVLKELASKDFETFASGLTHVTPSLVVPHLIKALQQDSRALKLRALSLIGYFGEGAVQSTPMLESILKAPKDAEERYDALVSLIRINPDSEQLIPFIRREIRGLYRDELLSERLSDSQRKLFLQILQTPQSFLEQQSAKALVKGTRTP